MVYFKDQSNVLHFLSDDDIANGGLALMQSLSGPCEQISDSEAEAIRSQSEPAPTETDYSNAIQFMLDSKARERQYDSIASAISYRGDINPVFSAEADALFAWRSAVWTYATAQLGAVTAGQRAQPTINSFLAELPAFVWPVLP